jgi:hypothetical protein
MNTHRPLIHTIAALAVGAVFVGTSITSASASAPAVSARHIADYLKDADRADVEVLAESALRDRLMDAAVAQEDPQGAANAELVTPEVMDPSSTTGFLHPADAPLVAAAGAGARDASLGCSPRQFVPWLQSLGELIDWIGALTEPPTKH